jgi:hypothetical protein
MRNNQDCFGQNRALSKGTLLEISKKVFVPASPPITAGYHKHHTWHSLTMLHNQCKFGRNWAVTKATLFFTTKHILSATRLMLQRCDTPQAVQVSSKWGRSEGHITLDVERPIRLYVASHCSGAKQTSRMAVSPRVPKPVHVRSKSGSIEGHITIKTEKAFVPASPLIASGWFKHDVALSSHATQKGQVSSKSGYKKGHFKYED